MIETDDPMPEMTTDLTGRILSLLLDRYGTHPWNWHTQQKPFEVLIATVLSQRTRDEKTDEAARALFSEYASAAALADAPIEEIERLIRPVNYFKTKAQRIKQISRILVEQYCGAPPESVEEMLKLPGVGLKTASCVMVYGFKKAAMPVDIHVHRISNRIGLIETKTPEESEKALWKVVPNDYLLHINELLVKHGQTICRPITPRCTECPVQDYCLYNRKKL
jgi:endonuclease-3